MTNMKNDKYLFISSAVLLSYTIIFLYVYYFVLRWINQSIGIYLIPILSLLIFYILGFYFHKSDNLFKAKRRGAVFISYSVFHVLFLIYSFSVGISQPWSYNIQIDVVVFRSYITDIALVLTTYLYVFLVMSISFKKLKAREKGNR